MRTLQRQLKILGERNRDGGDKTQHQRARILSQMADQLYQMGFRELAYDQVGGRHVNRLLKRWEEEDLSPGTIKNRMAVLRWWAQKIGRGHILSKSNDDYDIPRRQYVTNISKGIKLAPHAWGSGILFAASIHMAMAAPNCHILEVSQGYMPMMYDLFNEPYDIRDGTVYALPRKMKKDHERATVVR